MKIKLFTSMAAVAAMAALAVVPAAASAAPHWYKKAKLVSGTVVTKTGGNLTFASPMASIKCKVSDTEEIWNPSAGGAGEDLVTAFTATACKVVVGSSACPKAGSTPVVLANGLPWPSILVAGTPIRDEIKKVRFKVACNAGAVPDEFEGTLLPAVGNGKLEFGGPGSGELQDPSLNKMTVTGSDAIVAGPGKITAQDP
jgi:hypothetical protein